MKRQEIYQRQAVAKSSGDKTVGATKIAVNRTIQASDNITLLDSQFSARTETALAQALPDHMRYLAEHWSDALTKFGFEGAWLSAGEAHFHFQDDQGPKFKPNPHLAQWVDPKYISPGSHLWIRPGKPAVLFLHTPADYWHAPAPLPQEHTGALEVQTFDNQEELIDACQKAAKETTKLAFIGDGNNEVYISAATTWEISIKRRLGKLEAPPGLESVVEDERFIGLSISLYHGNQAGRLPLIHRDPFDRMLIAQAQAEGLVLVTADPVIPEYGIETIPANG